MGKTKQATPPKSGELNKPKSVGLQQTKVVAMPRGFRPMILSDYKPLPRFRSGCSTC